VGGFHFAGKFSFMKHNFSTRRRVFWRIFLLLGCACVITLLLNEFAIRLGWSWILPLGTALVVSAVAGGLLSGRIAGLSSSFTAAIESRSLHQAERQTAHLRGTLYEEPAIEWQKALHNLQNTCFDKQAEAGQHYATLTELMRMIAKAIDERTTYLRGHSERVASYSADIARELGIDADQVERIRLAALLHDIGTVGIEDSIVRKEAPLTPEEFEIVKAHTVKGASILRPIAAIGDLIPGVELHHESLDGQGYPYGLRGDEIPMMARIIAVADSFDAMTTTRPYQAAMDAEYVLEVLNRLATKRYDPSAVNALTTLVKNGSIVVKNPRTPVSLPQQRVLSEVI
jgi:putative nucleotidyltransferase with HDIG domain